MLPIMFTGAVLPSLEGSATHQARCGGGVVPHRQGGGAGRRPRGATVSIDILACDIVNLSVVLSSCS